MKTSHLLSLTAIAFTAGCAGISSSENGVPFETIRPVLETNCVHCHGTARLSKMPSFNDTNDFAKLIGPKKWIVPGKPDESIFFYIVRYADEHPGAMPPTGHAISKAELEKLRTWIAAGASMPTGEPITLKPRGEPPRSR